MEDKKVKEIEKTQQEMKEEELKIKAPDKTPLEVLLGDDLYKHLEDVLGENKIRTITDFYICMAFATPAFKQLALTEFAIRHFSRMIISPIKKQLVLPQDVSEALQKRMESTKPIFVRQESHRYKRLGDAWRRPRGLHSKLRKKLKYRTPMVSIGYGSDKRIRGLHPSGYEPKWIHNISQIGNIDVTKNALIIGATVGRRKRMDIERYCIDNKIYVINRCSDGLRYTMKRQKEISKNE